MVQSAGSLTDQIPEHPRYGGVCILSSVLDCSSTVLLNFLETHFVYVLMTVSYVFVFF